MEAGKRKGAEVKTEGKEGHRQAEPSRRQSTAEAGASQAPELEGDRKTDGAGGTAREVGGSELASFLYCVQDRIPSLCKWPRVLP